MLRIKSSQIAESLFSGGIAIAVALAKVLSNDRWIVNDILELFQDISANFSEQPFTAWTSCSDKREGCLKF